MITIKDEIDLEIDWVIRETTRIKLLPHRYEFIEEEKDIYYKSMVPMIYAYLEGFVKNAIRIYMKFVNQLDLTFNDISIRLLVHKIEKKYNCFKENIKSIQNKEKLVEQLLQDINNNDKTINFNDKAIQNINSDRLNKLLRELNFKEIEDRKIKDGLNKLLQYRNGIAHGENRYRVDENLLMEFIDTIIKTMDYVSDIICNGYDSKNYLKKIDFTPKNTPTDLKNNRIISK